jgi:hypothetical protein
MWPRRPLLELLQFGRGQVEFDVAAVSANQNILADVNWWSIDICKVRKSKGQFRLEPLFVVGCAFFARHGGLSRTSRYFSVPHRSRRLGAFLWGPVKSTYSKPFRQLGFSYRRLTYSVSRLDVIYLPVAALTGEVDLALGTRNSPDCSTKKRILR